MYSSTCATVYILGLNIFTVLISHVQNEADSTVTDGQEEWDSQGGTLILNSFKLIELQCVYPYVYRWTTRSRCGW